MRVREAVCLLICMSLGKQGIMGLVEMILAVVGAVVLVISYVVPAGKAEKDAARAPEIDGNMIRDLVEREINGAKGHMNDMVDETLSYSMEKTERAMERLTNEKIMAINEYSEQVLAAINKNHQEVMFLYDMLNDKHENLVNTVSEASKKAKEIRQTVQDAEITVKEAAEMKGGDADAAAVKTGETESTMQGRPGQAGAVALEKNGSGTNSENVIKSENHGDKKGNENGGNAVEEIIPPNGVTKTGDDGFQPIAPKRVEVLYDMLEPEGTSPAGSMGDRQNAEPEDEKNHNNNDRILRLHKLGKSKTAIAKELGLGVGEVKLVIDLFEQE